MRTKLFLFILATVVLSATSAFSERRIFFITNNMKGDPVHNCLTATGGCGPSVANAYCRDHGFTQAFNYIKIDQGDITGAVPASESTVGHERFAIECTR
jgi:hypothetical protein